MNDIFYLYPNTIMAIIGTILNLFCVIVYFKKQFFSPVFVYYRILSINCFILNITGIPYTICNAIRYVADENRKMCAYYLTVYIALGSLLTYFQSVLEIDITE